MNQRLTKALINKKDEFYTTYDNISSEVGNYTNQLKGKTIYCNTDNHDSNFVKYFKDNFEQLKLKKLIYSCIDGYVVEFDGRREVERKIDGDFRSDDVIYYLQLSDIVVTNPPFSLFREYVKQLMEYNKRFLIIGNFNAVTYKDIFPLLLEGSVWLGHHANKQMEFKLPQTYEKWSRMDSEGNKYGNVPSITWFTNMKKEVNNKFIQLNACYYGNEHNYPFYENYRAINVDKVKEIPKDYKGIMGVPITFLTKYNPEQFELLGIASGNSRANGLYKCVPHTPHKQDRGGCGVVDGRVKYPRLFIRAK